jgi:hypothetical protein
MTADCPDCGCLEAELVATGNVGSLLWPPQSGAPETGTALCRMPGVVLRGRASSAARVATIQPGVARGPEQHRVVPEP